MLDGAAVGATNFTRPVAVDDVEVVGIGIGAIASGAEDLAEDSLVLGASEVAVDEQGSRMFKFAPGVSLDEEGARLVQYQNSYNAAAKVIQTVQEMYDTLLGMI